MLMYIILFIVFAYLIAQFIKSSKYKAINRKALKIMGIPGWKYRQPDEVVIVKSARSVDSYIETKYFKDDKSRLYKVKSALYVKEEYRNKLVSMLENERIRSSSAFRKFEREIKKDLYNCLAYRIEVKYSSPTGRSQKSKILRIDKAMVENIENNPSLCMTKTQVNKNNREANKKMLADKQHKYYEQLNKVIEIAIKYKEQLIITGDKEKVDYEISNLLDRTVNTIKKIKSVDSEEWVMIDNVISQYKKAIEKIVLPNQKILKYYQSEDFAKIKETCNSLMSTQKEFNEYIDKKAQSIQKLFGARIIRNETVNNDEHSYIRPYKKSITPFTAEVSSTVFASAENNPIDYIIKYFYPNKEKYPEQIQKLQLLIEELETLREAKGIIDTYKKDYQQYITEVPSFVIENDENGFYKRLGFADISENALTVEYKFIYTSDGGFAQRSFTVPMTEETIVELIERLQNKLTMKAFVKEQRNLMTSKLRNAIKERDNYTCKFCGNSTHKEPNLLLEIDHIIPVSKGGCTVEDNLQTLCWKCNRAKADKIL